MTRNLATTETTIIGSMFSNQMIGNAGNNVLFGRGSSGTYRAGNGIDYISRRRLVSPMRTHLSGSTG